MQIEWFHYPQRLLNSNQATDTRCYRVIIAVIGKVPVLNFVKLSPLLLSASALSV